MKKNFINVLKYFKLEKLAVSSYFYIISKTSIKNIEFQKSNFHNKIYTRGNPLTYPDIPKIIWMFWYDVNIPNLIRICIERIIDLNPDYEIKLLNRYSVNDFIDIDLDNSKIPLANVTDLIRLKLLKQYGGVWLDASIIMNRPIDWFIDNEINNVDLICFYREVLSTNITYPVVESWFLMAPKESRYISAWLENFELIESIGSKEFFKTIESRPDYLEIKQGISPPEYLVVYLANQITLKEIKECNLIMHLSDESAYILQDTLGWRSYKTHAYLAIIDAPNDLSPIYKLTSGDRKYMDILFDQKLINPKSILGKIL